MYVYAKNDGSISTSLFVSTLDNKLIVDIFKFMIYIKIIYDI